MLCQLQIVDNEISILPLGFFHSHLQKMANHLAPGAHKVSTILAAIVFLAKTGLQYYIIGPQQGGGTLLAFQK